MKKITKIKLAYTLDDKTQFKLETNRSMIINNPSADDIIGILKFADTIDQIPGILNSIITELIVKYINNIKSDLKTFRLNDEYEISIIQKKNIGKLISGILTANNIKSNRRIIENIVYF